MYISNDELSQIKNIVSNLKILDDQTLLLMVGEESTLDYNWLIEQLDSLGISFMGGIFPGIIHGKNNFKEGAILKVLPTSTKPIIITGLENNNFEISHLLEDLKFDTSKATLFTFIDGLTSNVATYLQKLYHHYGNAVKYLGAGAGSLSLVQQPCIFSNEGIFQDAAIICPVNLKANIGVKHGWEKLDGPIVATRTNKNIIHELNWKNAFEVYKDVAEKDSGIMFNDENFFDIAKCYPFGIFREDQEDLVRDPIAVDENGSLICVGEVPENTVLYILKGNNDALIQSAKTAIENSIANLTADIKHTFIIDCISRTLFLEEEFPKELEAISEAMPESDEKETIPQGVLSLGEISSSGKGYLEFYNKTLVIGTLTNF